MSDLSAWMQEKVKVQMPPLGIQIDEAFRVLAVEGDPEGYAMAVAPGQDLRESLPLLYGEDLDRAMSLDLVTIAPEVVVDVQLETTAGGAYVAVTDATERHQLAQRIQQERNEIQILRKQLDRALSTKERLLRSASNEFRLPLMAIRGQLKPLKTIAHDAVQPVDAINKAVDQLETLVDNLIDASQLDGERIMISPLPTRLRSFFESWADAYRPMCAARGVRLSMSVASNVPEDAVVDAMKMRQILVRLLFRAISAGRSSRVDFRVAADNGAAFIWAKDDGAEIPEEQRPAMFFALDMAATETPVESLGIVVSAAVARKMGGQLELLSSNADGSEFLFRMPTQMPKTGSE